MSHARSLARRYAVQAVYQWQLGGHSQPGDEPYFIADRDKGKIDRGYYDMLVNEVLSHHEDLDRQLAAVLDRAVAEVNPVELAILRIAAGELIHHPDVPYRVVINEAVELAKRFGAQNAHKYVNGILDAIASKVRTAEFQATSSQAGRTSA